jgi:hypothetical protein
MARTSTDPRADGSTYSTGAVALTATAGVFMVLAGAFHAFQGIVALANDEFFVVGVDYAFELDLTSWGWIHLIGGIVVALAGVALFQGATWARVVAVAIACLSILASFLWMPFYPLWSLTVIAFDAFVIWAVTAHGRDITVENP